MPPTSKSRVVAIGQVSSYLIWFTVLSMFVILVCALGALGVTWMSLPSGDLNIPRLILQSINPGDDYFDWIKRHGVTSEARIFLMFCIVALAASLEYLMLQLNQLLTCFSSGEIFNRKAIGHARYAFYIAFFSSLFYYAVQLLALTCSLMFWQDGKVSYFFRIFADALGDTVWIGISLLIIWSLEIGAELNDEVELTI
ncbi:hypothetical protein ACO0K7_16900 [Undibacterium sp. Ji67W]|uniref:hypothetical protein n=1 Tax=Undibacterium sp. Ji67W TaxID=3413042 RepID=UPI003BF36A78